MAKKTQPKPKKGDIEIELEDIIEQNQNRTKGIKKIIDSIENKNNNK